MFTDLNVNLIQETPSQQQPDSYREFIDRNKYPGTVACDSEHRRGLRDGPQQHSTARTHTRAHSSTPESDCPYISQGRG